MRLSVGEKRGGSSQAAVRRPDRAGAGNFGGAGPMTPKFCVKTRAVTSAGRVDHQLRFRRGGQRNFRLTRRVSGFTDDNPVHRAPN